MLQVVCIKMQFPGYLYQQDPTLIIMLFAHVIVLVFTIVRFVLFSNAAQCALHPGQT